MTTNVPLLVRFAAPFGRVGEPSGPEEIGVSNTERSPVVAESFLNSRGESRFTKVRNETTDDE